MDKGIPERMKEVKAVTPSLLACLADETGGASLEANLSLLRSNAELPADVAMALAARYG